MHITPMLSIFIYRSNNSIIIGQPRGKINLHSCRASNMLEWVRHFFLATDNSLLDMLLCMCNLEHH